MSKKSNQYKGKFYRFTHWCIGGLIRTLYRVRITGCEHIPEGGALICANHIGYPDALVLASVIPKQIHFLAKAELFRIPLLGPVIRALGAISVKRNSADVGAIREVVSLSQNGAFVAIFPQGHRRYGKNPPDTEIKNGIGMMAYRSGMPVLPVCIKMKRERYALFRSVNVIVGEPVLYSELACEHTPQDYSAVSRILFNQACLLGGYQPKLLPKGEKK